MMALEDFWLTSQSTSESNDFQIECEILFQKQDGWYMKNNS